MRLNELVNSILNSNACFGAAGDNCIQKIYNGERLLWSTNFYELSYYPKLATSMEKGKLYAILTNENNYLCLDDSQNLLDSCSHYRIGDYGEYIFNNTQFIMRARETTRSLGEAFGLYTNESHVLYRGSSGYNILIREGEIFIDGDANYKLWGSSPSLPVGFSNNTTDDTKFAVYELTRVPRQRYYIEEVTTIEIGENYCFLTDDKALSSTVTVISGYNPGIHFNSYQDTINYRLCPDNSVIFENDNVLIVQGGDIMQTGEALLNLSIYSSRLIYGYLSGTSNIAIDNDSYIYDTFTPGQYLRDSTDKVRFTYNGDKFKIYKLTPVIL